MTEPSNSLDTEKNTTLKDLLKPLCFLIALIPIINIFWLITTVGCDNVSNDYLTYAHLLDKGLSGQYDYSHLVSDTFYRGHATTLAFLVHLASGAWFFGSIMPELYLGFCLAVARLYFWYDAIRVSIGKENANNTYWLLPLISFFIFSNSQISLFSYPGATLPIGISLFGQALGIWSLARFGPSLKGVILAGVGGLISSYSWGIGPITWLLLMTYYLVLKQFNWQKFLLLSTCAGLSAIPYLMSLFVKGDNTGAVELSKTVVSIFNIKVIVSLLGWPLANDIASNTSNLKEATFAGTFAIIFAVCLIISILLHRKLFTVKELAVPILLLLSGFLTVWEISMVRALLAPWYAALAIPFWCGMFALVALLFTKMVKETDLPIRSRVTLKFCMLTIVLAVACYAKSNLTWADKTYLLKGRAPSSVSALYHAEKAPTYADQYVFLWTPGSPSLLQKLAEVLHRHNMSVFSPKRTIWLQGDYMLNSVKVHTKSDANAPYFTSNPRLKTRADWSDYKRLDLVIPAGSSLTWQLDIPKNLIAGSYFRTSLMDTHHSSNSSAVINIDGSKKKFTAKEMADPNFKIDLYPYKGSSLILTFSSPKETAVLKEPRIYFNEELSNDIKRSNYNYKFDWRPDNTKYGEQLKPFNPETDVKIDLSQLLDWKATNAVLSKKNDNLSIVSSSHDATVRYLKNINIPVRNAGQIVVKVAASSEMKMRLLKMTLKTDSAEKPFVTYNLPLLGTDTMQEYSYPVRLLNLEEGRLIESISIKTLDQNTDIEISAIDFQAMK